MKKSHALIVLALLALPLSACTMPYGGQGFTSNNVPVQGEMVLVSGRSAHEVRLTSADGWTCTGIYDHAARRGSNSTMFSFPLTCDNGDRGNAIYSVPFNGPDTFYPGQTRVSFSLNSGEKGFVAL